MLLSDHAGFPARLPIPRSHPIPGATKMQEVARYFIAPGSHSPAKILWPFIKFETSGGFSFEPESCYKRRDRFEAKGQNGSHNSFSKSGDPEGLNFQNRKGKIVPYQAKQLGKKIKEYLAKRDDDEQAGKE